MLNFRSTQHERESSFSRRTSNSLDECTYFHRLGRRSDTVRTSIPECCTEDNISQLPFPVDDAAVKDGHALSGPHNGTVSYSCCLDTLILLHVQSKDWRVLAYKQNNHLKYRNNLNYLYSAKGNENEPKQYLPTLPFSCRSSLILFSFSDLCCS